MKIQLKILQASSIISLGNTETGIGIIGRAIDPCSRVHLPTLLKKYPFSHTLQFLIIDGGSLADIQKYTTALMESSLVISRDIQVAVILSGGLNQKRYFFN